MVRMRDLLTLCHHWIKFCYKKPQCDNAEAALHDVGNSCLLEAAAAFEPVDGTSQAKGQHRLLPQPGCMLDLETGDDSSQNKAEKKTVFLCL